MQLRRSFTLFQETKGQGSGCNQKSEKKSSKMNIFRIVSSLGPMWAIVNTTFTLTLMKLGWIMIRINYKYAEVLH